ncbi:ABC transporter substrate-binding protein [Spongisporangium articulatum]|uniref:ABC transporter substrate-binding protein n=1 Tax=Spongisporangium articulatum TaxID=3362603 RepID=A0ABW8AVI0_9ACTN
MSARISLPVKRSRLAVALTVVAGLALSACGGGSSGGGTASTSAAAPAVDLKAAGCPATVTIQTDWNPEGEHGHLYQMLGTDYTVDADKKSVSGPLMYKGAPTGVNVEIRSGGPAIGFATVTSQMYQDKKITLGYVSTDEAVQLSAKNPTKAVFAPLEKGPQMIMWDPATYPNVTDIKSLGQALVANKGVVRYFGGAAYMEYLKGSGILPASVIDGTYDGTPAKFVAAKGKDAQQGFASAEPYIYEKEVAAWGKPVKYQLTHDMGYPIYASAVSVRSGELAELTPCLKKLVPVLQQAEVDYFANPAATNKLILELVTKFNNGWVYSQGVADYSVATMKSIGLVSNGANSTIGDMDEARVQKIIDIDTPIYTKSNSAPKAGLKPLDISTNEFLDTSIGLK